MTRLITNATIIIRTVGERTTHLCHQLIRSQVSENNIFIINEAPFSQAVRKTFEIGLDGNLPWTIAVDADVLVGRNGIHQLIESAESYHKPFFKGNAKAVDKFLGYARYLPPHIYPTSLLEQALLALPDEYGLRPETEVRQLMKTKTGMEQAYFSKIVAIHDFEQYYTDIYRKCFVFGKKHLSRIKHYVPYWASMLKDDKDFLVAMAGLFKGLYSNDKIEIDVNKLPRNYKESVLLSNLDEKADILQSPRTVHIQKIIQKHILKNYLKKIYKH